MRLGNLLLAMTLPALFACSDRQLRDTLKTIDEAIGKDSPGLSTAEVVSGLKQALEVGIANSASVASRLDGYYANPQIAIPFPPDAREVADKLRDVGLGREVDRFVETLNRGAENAAGKSVPIFVDAIRAMSIEDAWGILKGGDFAATEYLRQKTSTQLQGAFRPVVADALRRVDATRYYTDIVAAYNRIPLVTKVDAELDDYATREAIAGLFYLVGQEEAKIRKDPVQRTTDLLRKVFGELDKP